MYVLYETFELCEICLDTARAAYARLRIVEEVGLIVIVILETSSFSQDVIHEAASAAV